MYDIKGGARKGKQKKQLNEKRPRKNRKGE